MYREKFSMLRKLFRRSSWARCSFLCCFGFMIGLLIKDGFHFTTPNCHAIYSPGKRNDISIRKQVDVSTFQMSSNIYVGMMSAGKYLSNRVQRALDTWLPKGPWKVEVFADGDQNLLSVPPDLDFKIITLPSVDDKAYPPQKKCFMMIRHMFDKHINNYDWFMRVDDDAYLDYPRLSYLLSSMNSSLPIFFGSPGFGIDPDDGMEVGMYYLMGGPGMIFSRGLLRLLRSQLRYCVRHMFSPHEDIEIGRCVWKQVEKSIIPKAWEILEFFYQQYDKVTGDVINIVFDELSRERTKKTVSYHAVKKEDLLYRLHKLVMQRKIEALINKTASYKREMHRMNALLTLHEAISISPKSPLSNLSLILGGQKSSNDEHKSPLLDKDWPEEVPWTPPVPLIPRYSSQLVWLNWDKYYRHQQDSVVPMRGHSAREQAILWNWMAEAQEKFMKESCPMLGKDPQFVNGYFKSTPLDGVYLSMIYKAYSSSGLKYCNLMIQVSYGVTLSNELSTNLTAQVAAIKDSNCADVVKSFNPNGNPPQLPPLCSFRHQPRVVLVIPLQGRYRAMERFMERYEKSFLQPRISAKHSPPDTPIVQLVIVLLRGSKDDLGLNDAASNLLKGYQNTYGTTLIRYHVASTGGRAFSRGAGIQLGSLAANPEDILFFMDIDMIVTPNLVNQCRKLSAEGSTAWYPISFSQYDPDKLCFHGGLARSVDESSILDMMVGGEAVAPGHQRIRYQIDATPLILSEERGFWRDFGYGIACMYKSDFIRAGGFDLSIDGWGEEDIRMYLSLLKSGLDVFRIKQEDLIHIHHAKHCDSSLQGEQAKACMRTKASHYASQKCLAKTFLNKIKIDKA